MMKLMLLMFGVISPFSVQVAALPVAPETSWTAVEPQVTEVVTVADERSGQFESFRTLNGISLDHGLVDVMARKGQPLKRLDDPYLGCPEFDFEDARIGVCQDEDVIQYIHVEGRMKRFMLNQQLIDMDIDSIRNALGQPYSTAQDGEVFVRGERALKVYMAPGTERILGIDLFDESVT